MPDRTPRGSSRSRYDELHDLYSEIQTNKTGTRYERLAAVVFAALDNNNIAIHDLKVVGDDTGVKHQIDVLVENAGRKKRVLIECKDFDVSGDPVGLGVVRDFFGVVSDVRPDEAWVITCNGFTKDARQYAKGKGIKLATLRIFSDSDWEGRIRTIVTTLVFKNFRTDKLDVRIRTVTDADAAAFLAELGGTLTIAADPKNDRTQIFDGTSVRSITEIATQITKREPTDPKQTEAVESQDGIDGWVSPTGSRRYPITGFSVSMPFSQIAMQMTIGTADGAAKLLLWDGEGLDFVLWDDTLQGYTIDENGQVHLAPEATQKRLFSTIAPIPVPGSV